MPLWLRCDRGTERRLAVIDLQAFTTETAGVIPTTYIHGLDLLVPIGTRKTAEVMLLSLACTVVQVPAERA